MKKILARIDNSIFYLENGIILLTLGSMVILSFLQVLMRNFFNSGFLWGDILLRHLVLWVGFAGASLATRQEKHINIDLLTRVVAAKYLPPVKMLVDLFAIVVCIVLARASYVFLSFEKEAGTIIFADVPAWYLQIILPLGFLLIAFRFLLRMMDRVMGLLSKNNPQDK